MTRCVHRRWPPTLALLALLVATAVGSAAAGPGVPSAPVERPATRAVTPAPLIAQHGFADPAVEWYAGGLVAAATGPGNAIRAAAPGPVGPFVDLSPAFESWPSWAVPDKDVWAPDLAKVGGRWLMFYAVRVTDLGTEGRCIAVAAAPTPDATFHPVGDRPLVCPANAQTPRAEDRVRGRTRDLPREGVIDPSLFRSRRGKLFLLYRTQGMPSTIRMVRLASDGTRVPDLQKSRELIRNPGIVENPVLVQRDGRFVLLTSEGWFGHCRYRTLWQRSRSVWRLGGHPVAGARRPCVDRDLRPRRRRRPARGPGDPALPARLGVRPGQHLPVSAGLRQEGGREHARPEARVVRRAVAVDLRRPPIPRQVPGAVRDTPEPTTRVRWSCRRAPRARAGPATRRPRARAG